jgi:hypothetical protein
MEVMRCYHFVASVGKKLNKKDLLSTNLATKKGYCTQRVAAMSSAGIQRTNLSI